MLSLDLLREPDVDPAWSAKAHEICHNKIGVNTSEPIQGTPCYHAVAYILVD